MKKSITFKRIIFYLLLLATGSFITATPAVAQPVNEEKLFLPFTLRAIEGESSIQRIERALAAGAISDEQALIYKVQVIFGDPALPAQYHVEDLDQDGTSVITEALERLDSLSPGTRAVLEPYLRAPSQPDSWIALHEPLPAMKASPTALTWRTIDAVGGKVKVWYHPEYAGDGVRAQKLAAELQRHIWPTLTGAFRSPLPDCGAACTEGGGDTRVDIYIAHISRSFVRAFEIDRDGTAAFMVLRPDASLAIAAHELMHMIQFAYPVVAFGEYDWVFESTAQWAMDFVYPNDNLDPDFPKRHEEQLMLPYLFNAPNLSLELNNDQHEYASYLYWFFQRSVTPVVAVLQNMSNPNSLENANTATAGGFQNAWPLFALYNWNQSPVEHYKEWDELEKSPERIVSTLTGQGEETFPIEVNHLAARYYRFDLLDSVRRVRIELPLELQAADSAHVWAILKIDGVWGEPENWTNVREKVFCRDNPGENVEEIVLIISNSHWQDRSHVLAPGDGKIDTFLSCGCQEADAFQEWTGTASMSYNKTASDGDTSAETARQAQLSFRLTRQPNTAFDNYRWQGNPIGSSNASVNDSLSSSGGNTFTWIGNEIMPDTNRIRLEINPATCRYEIWVGVFVDAVYNYGSGEREEIQHMEFRVYEIPLPDEVDDWPLTGSQSVPVYVGGGNEGIDRLFTGPGVMGQLDLILDGELGGAPVTWSFTPVAPELK